MHFHVNASQRTAILMRSVSISFARALLSQLHFRMLLLSLVPLALSVLIWGAVLSLVLNPMLESIRDYFVAHDGFKTSGTLLARLGLSAINTVLGPLIAMWMLLPLVILTTLIFVATIAMPLISRHVGRRRFPELEERRGGSFLGSLWRSMSSFAVFVVLWIATLPLTAIPGASLLVHPLLLGWFTCRMLAYDALAGYADAQEILDIPRIHRWRLLAIGVIAGALGAIPGMLWLGSAWILHFLPAMALLAIWLYVLVFIFAGLWFVHYCLDALSRNRAAIALSAEPGILNQARAITL
jgi:hypothetical protein